MGANSSFGVTRTSSTTSSGGSRGTAFSLGYGFGRGSKRESKSNLSSGLGFGFPESHGNGAGGEKDRVCLTCEFYVLFLFEVVIRVFVSFMELGGWG